MEGLLRVCPSTKKLRIIIKNIHLHRFLIFKKYPFNIYLLNNLFIYLQIYFFLGGGGFLLGTLLVLLVKSSERLKSIILGYWVLTDRRVKFNQSTHNWHVIIIISVLFAEGNRHVGMSLTLLDLLFLIHVSQILRLWVKTSMHEPKRTRETPPPVPDICQVHRQIDRRPLTEPAGRYCFVMARGIGLSTLQMTWQLCFILNNNLIYFNIWSDFTIRLCVYYFLPGHCLIS